MQAAAMANDPFDSGSELSSEDETHAPVEEPKRKVSPAATDARKRQRREQNQDASAKNEPAASAPRTEREPQSEAKREPQGETKSDHESAARREQIVKKTQDATSIVQPRAARPQPRKSEPSFGHNMSGWDQLFGGIDVGPKTDPKSKHATPEVRAAAKEKETEAAAAAARQARAAREEAAHKEKAVETMPEKRAQSMTCVHADSVDQITRLRRNLRAEIESPRPHLDLLEHCRTMLAFEEDMGPERRQLRATRFGAGLHYLQRASDNS